MLGGILKLGGVIETAPMYTVYSAECVIDRKLYEVREYILEGLTGHKRKQVLRKVREFRKNKQKDGVETFQFDSFAMLNRTYVVHRSQEQTTDIIPRYRFPKQGLVTDRTRAHKSHFTYEKEDEKYECIVKGAGKAHKNDNFPVQNKTKTLDIEEKQPAQNATCSDEQTVDVSSSYAINHSEKLAVTFSTSVIGSAPEFSNQLPITSEPRPKNTNKRRRGTQWLARRRKRGTDPIETCPKWIIRHSCGHIAELICGGCLSSHEDRQNYDCDVVTISKLRGSRDESEEILDCPCASCYK